MSVTLTSPETELGNLSACDTVDEFIQYSIDDGPVDYIVSNIYVSVQSDYIDIQYFNNDQSWENCFWIRGNLDSNYPNFEGMYSFNYQNTGFSFIEVCPVYPSEINNEITFNLSSFGNSVGE